MVGTSASGSELVVQVGVGAAAGVVVEESADMRVRVRVVFLSARIPCTARNSAH